MRDAVSALSFRERLLAKGISLAALIAGLWLPNVWAGSLEDHLQRKSSDETYEMIHSDVYVAGFPVIVGLRTSILPERQCSFPHRVYLRDFASNYEQSSGFAVLLGRSGDQAPLWLQGSISWRTGTFDAPDARDLQCGESLVSWFDLSQLIVPVNDVELGETYPLVGDFPAPGVTQMAMTGIQSALGSSSVSVMTVRKPSESERAVLETLRADGIGRSWFPSVVLASDDVPDASDLPVETRRIVALIGVLRSAVADSDSGIAAIDGAESGLWGYLAELVAMVKYECLLDTGRLTEATRFREQSLPERAGDFTMVDRGDGVVHRLRSLRDGTYFPFEEMDARRLREANERKRADQNRRRMTSEEAEQWGFPQR